MTEMRHYKYEAQDKSGNRIQGVLRAEDEHSISKMLFEMGYSPSSITQVSGPTLKFYYVGKDHSGKTVDGSVTAESTMKAAEKLGEMGIKNFRVSTSKNLDIPMDDSAADKLSKTVAAFMIFILFGASVLFMMSLNYYLKAHFLAETRSQLIDATIVDIKASTSNIQYVYEVNGREYKRFGYLKKVEAEKLNEGDTITIRYSINYPSVSRVGSGVPRQNTTNFKMVIISGLVIVVGILVLIYCSCFHYINRIMKARRSNRPIPKGDVKRLINNVLCAPLFPLIFLNMVAMFVAQDKTSLYYPYRFYFLVAAFALAALALYLRHKSPVYYD